MNVNFLRVSFSFDSSFAKFFFITSFYSRCDLTDLKAYVMSITKYIQHVPIC